jgi:hypothetical protein
MCEILRLSNVADTETTVLTTRRSFDMCGSPADGMTRALDRATTGIGIISHKTERTGTAALPAGDAPCTTS